MARHEAFEFPDDGPLVLAGEPGALRGEVTLRNPGAHRAVVRDARITSKVAEARVPFAAVLPPGQTERVRLSVSLGRDTPPGEHHGTLEIGGRSRPVVLQVAESVRLRVSPATVVVDQPPGATVRKRVLLANEGNVPLAIGEIRQVPIGEEQMLGRADRLADLGGAPRPVLKEAGVLRVRSHGSRTPLAPGEIRPLDLEIDVPEGLAEGARYVGRAPLHAADLEFVVVCPVHHGARSARR
jgi:hypothetical protein